MERQIRRIYTEGDVVCVEELSSDYVFDTIVFTDFAGIQDYLRRWAPLRDTRQKKSNG